MRHLVLLAATLAVFGGLAGCSTAAEKPPSNPAVKQSAILDKYLDADPVADARKAIKEGDLQFLAIRGYTILVPGVPDFREKYAANYTYRIIEGTSDTISSSADRAIQLQVRDYAKKYNQTLLSHVGD